MTEGIYNGAASLASLERWQNAISQNLASSGVSGFKKVDFSVEAVNGHTNNASPDGGTSGLNYVSMPRSGSHTNFSPGQIEHTGKPTDFAVEGSGFFQVQGPDGQPVYTRDGEFHVSPTGTLVTKQGRTVLGDSGPISIDPEKGPIKVTSDGTISQEDRQIGKLALFEFADTSVLSRTEGGCYTAPQGTNPAVATKSTIAQGSIEGSNVAPLTEMINLIAVSRAYQASQKLITSHDDLAQQTIRSLGNPQA